MDIFLTIYLGKGVIDNMVKFLVKQFIKDYTNISSPLVKQSYANLCSILGIFFNVFLSIFKILAGIISGSIAIITDGANNLSDAITAFLSYLGFKLAGIGAGSKHPFGHGRYEWIMSFLSGCLIFIMGMELSKESIKTILHPVKNDFSIIIVVILILSIMIKGYMYLYNNYIGNKIQSLSLKATATDCISDVISTLSVLITTLLQMIIGFSLDGWCGLLVSIFILVSSGKTIAEAVERILGQSPDMHTIQKVREIVLAFPEIININDLLIHDYGLGKLVISLHIELSSNISVDRIQCIVNQITYYLYQEMMYPATIQIDCINTDPQLLNTTKKEISKILSTFTDYAEITELKILEATSFSNVIITVNAPDILKKQELILQKTLNTALQEIDQKYHVILKLNVLSKRKGVLQNDK